MTVAEAEGIVASSSNWGLMANGQPQVDRFLSEVRDLAGIMRQSVNDRRAIGNETSRAMQPDGAHRRRQAAASEPTSTPANRR